MPESVVQRLREAVRERFPQRPPVAAGLRASGPGEFASLSDGSTKRAAVLVPLLRSGSGLDVLLFERSAHVLEHVGEICFPGGSLEACDKGPIEAALREANEELGIPTDAVEVIGLLDVVQTHVSNYTISPVVGYVAEPAPLVVDPREVARIITIPLGRLLEPGVEAKDWVEYEGLTRLRYSYTLGHNRIWGATARILHSLLQLVKSTA